MGKSLGAALAAVSIALAAPHVFADSAADKATAREVATEGIGLYKSGDYAGALDRLRRAQALYDAPVHLLYIARAEEKLGQLVEAAETYRTLDRATLPAGAPEAWTSAVEDGRKELSALEPRVPKLKIAIEPRDAPEPTVQIDGVAVSAAVLGIARPVNPGAHHVVVSAKGFAPAEVDAAVKEGEARDVALTLTPSAEPVPGGAAPPAEPAQHSFVGFLGGIRLGVGIPTGKIEHEPSLNRDLATTDFFQPGGGLELHAGVRIGRYFTPLLYVDGYSLSPGDGIFGFDHVKKPTASSFGIGLIVGTPPGKMGGFGEIDLVLLNTYTASVTYALKPNEHCDVSVKGTALRFGGGGVFPLATWFQLVPFATASIGQFNKIEGTGGCPDKFGRDIDSGDKRTHAMIVLGVGGDVVLGRTR